MNFCHVDESVTSDSVSRDASTSKPSLTGRLKFFSKAAGVIFHLKVGQAGSPDPGDVTPESPCTRGKEGCVDVHRPEQAKSLQFRFQYCVLCGNAYRCLQAKRDRIVTDSEWVRGSQVPKPTLDFRTEDSGLKIQDSGFSRGT